MKITWLLGSFICASALLQAAPQSPKNASQEAPAYDADLFKRDVSVVSFHGSFLYWRVQEGALDYAIKMQQAPSAGETYASGKFHTATFNGDPGFRVAMSYFRAPKYWEVWGQYTRLTARGKNGVGRPEDPSRFLNGTWPQPTDSPISKAESHIHMNYNVADLLVDRFFNPNPHLRLRLIGGATAAWINQNWQIRYMNLQNQVSLNTNKWKFVGGGLRLGAMLDWFWGYNVYVTATATCGSLLGTYHNTSRLTSSTAAGALRDTHYSDVRPAITVQGSFGPSWQKNFAWSRMEIFAGYELNTWFNLQEMYRSTLSSATSSKQTFLNTGMVALQGLTARATVDF